MGKKGKKGNAGGDIWDDEDMQQPEAQEFGAAAAEGSSESPAAESSGFETPQVASAADDFEDGGLMGALRKSKKKKDEAKAAEDAAAAAKAAAAQANVPQIKSKKEKEREKKEREKAKKKAQSERKKTAPPVVKKEKASAETTPEPEETDGASSANSSKTASAGKGGKKNKVLAALQKQIAARKEAEEAERKAEEEARLAEEEAIRQAEEEEKAKEEARRLKKEKEKAKIAELKAQGKYLTKKQKAEQALQEKRRQQLLNSGVIVEGLQESKPKRPVYGKSTKKQQATPQATPEPEAKPEAKAETKEEPVKPEPEKEPETPAPTEEEREEQEEEDLLLDADDWEAALGGDDEEQEEKESSPSSAVEEEEEEEKPEKKAEEVKPKKAPVPAAKSSTKAPDSDESVLSKGEIALSEARQAEIHEKREERKEKALASASESNLRSPICCILGHVDTGKTKLLDKIRQTNVQEGEAGGITQQIGATYFPIEAIKQKTEVMKRYVTPQYNVPGLLVIDTPGHESFTNLRTRGSSLCNIAILVVDIMHGLEPQTIESIRLLRERKTPFVVALNKIDRLYDWEAIPNNSFRDSLSKQKASVQREFQDRYEKAKLALAEQGLNSELYYQNKSLGKTVSIIPTSAHTGEGVPDLLYLLLELTQSRMSKQLMYLSELEATILEVKVVEGLGTTIDVVLSNGILREGDRIVLCGQNGPIATNVRALLTPQPLRELRVKSAFVHHKEVKAALGVKIAANDLEKAVAGSRLLVVGPDDDEEELMDDVMDDLTDLLDSVDKSGVGVCVQASTLGSLEALLDFLKDMKIPVMSIGIGPVFKRDVMRATTMLEKKKEYALMLCFDVRIDKEAEQYAQEQNIKIFSADIIYHLFDDFTNYQKKMLEERRKEQMHMAVYPCVLKTIQIINKRNPMIIGVDVVEGSVRVGTPIGAVRNKQVIPLGRVVSLEVNHKTTDIVRKGQTNAGVAMRLEAGSGQQPTWGRHVDESDNLYSIITRKSIDVLKDPAFRSEVPRDDWLLIKNLKPIFDIK